jgi:tRNA (guanine-N7-)-methyltransferase
MPEAKELRLELGCGKGRFTCQTAAKNPDILFVAVERVPDAMVMAMEKAKDMGLTNVFYIDADAALLPEFFAPEEVDLIYVNFCDPWPPKRHAKRRLTHRNFLKLYREVLKEKGQIHFKTDNAPLFEFSVLEFPAAGYDLEEVTRDLHANGICGIMTDYEEKFHNMGTKINRCVGIKGELPPEPEQPEDEETPAEEPEN